MKIAVDAVGGDYYPNNPIIGAIDAVNENTSLTVILVGPEDLIKESLEGKDYPAERIQIQHAPEIVGMNESPAKAIKTKQNSSIAVGLTLHKKQLCDGFVSAGNTGALLAASTVILGRLEGISRPAIASVFPTINGFRILVDAGANLEVKPEYLYQFGVMGKIYTENVLGVNPARVGLLNVGEEEEKGTDVIREAHQLLKTIDTFVGNIEGRDILPCNADVFVCDGYIGNITLKFGESIAPNLHYMIKEAIIKNNLEPKDQKLVADVMGTALAPFDYQRVGGVPFLGVDGVSLVGHGSSSPLAIKNMILGATRCVKTNINTKIITFLN